MMKSLTLLTSSRNTGFTLIEILVVVTIMIIILGAGIAGFINFSDRRQVEQTGRQVQQLFVMAQQKAAVREVPQVCLTGSRPPLRAYRVRISANPPHTVTVVAICAANTITNISISTVGPLPAGVVVSDPVVTLVTPPSVTISPGSSFLDFYTLEGGVNAGRTYQFTGATTYGFTVDIGGRISNVQ